MQPAQANRTGAHDRRSSTQSAGKPIGAKESQPMVQNRQSRVAARECADNGWLQATREGRIFRSHTPPAENSLAFLDF
jgi:hypothetical protein